jgi:adenylylsulfate kinase-like enzyme
VKTVAPFSLRFLHVASRPLSSTVDQGATGSLSDDPNSQALSAKARALTKSANSVISEFRRAFADHRQEVRQALATTTTTELVVRLHTDIKNARSGDGGVRKAGHQAIKN